MNNQNVCLDICTGVFFFYDFVDLIEKMKKDKIIVEG